MNREEVIDIVKRAQAEGERPNLRCADLRGANLSSANLYCANLSSANLYCADLRGADLSSANLYCADLRGANLYCADLRGANLYCADLRGANLYCADLSSANLYCADLRGADLWGADLSSADLSFARWDGLEINHLPSGTLRLTPTPEGWHITLGCWRGTPDQLRDLIAQDQGWPEAKGEEITRRRPYIEAALTLCDVHMQDHAHIIPTLAEKWGDKENNQ